MRDIKTFLIEKTVFASITAARNMVNKTMGKELPPVITISRQHGCYAAEIGGELTKFLGSGWSVFHREIIESMAKDAGVAKEYMEEFDEKTVSLVEEIIESFTRMPINEEEYLSHLRKILFGVAKKGKVIIIGRGANFILKQGFNIRLVAPKDWRSKQLAEIDKISQSKAKEELENSDRQRKQYIQKLFSRDIDDPVAYDLIINTQYLNFKEVAKIIYEAAKIPALFK